jgi:Glycosyltransferase family 87
VLWPALALLGVYGLSFVLFALRLSAFPFDVDQGESYDAWSGWLLNIGQLPYTDNEQFPYYSHGYPPLWSYLVSIPMAWLGPGLGAARALSSLAALLAAGLVGATAWRLGGRASSGALAAMFFLASPYVFHTTPLARVNATMLLLGLLALTLFERPTPRRVVLGALVLVAALFTKPTSVDAVAAGLGYVLLVRPRLALLGAAVVVGVGGITAMALQTASGGTYWLNVLGGNSSAFDLEQLRDYILNFGLLHGVLVGLAGVEVVARLRERCLSPWVLYFPAALVLALATIGKTGAGESYFLQTLAVAAVLASLRITRLLERAGNGWVEPALGLALLAQAIVLAHGPLSEMVPWLPDRGPQSELLGRAPSAQDALAGQLLVNLVRQAPGPALAEDASFVVVAGKPLVGATPPSLRNLYHAGLWDPTPLVADLRAHRYAIVVLNAELYPEPVLAAIGQFYFQDRAVQMNGSTYRVFLPGSP